MVEISTVIQAITRIARPVATPIIDRVQRNEIVIKILKDLKIDPTQPRDDFESVYAYALVEYGVFKSESILNLYREREIKSAFWRAFNSNNFQSLVKNVENFLDWNVLGDEIRAANIELRRELEEFSRAFITVAKLTRTPAEVMRDKEFRLILQELNQLQNPSEFNAEIDKLSPQTTSNILPYSEEFAALIQEKTSSFCGRKFVFEALEQFIDNHTKGYFTVIGDAGMGKSAIAAKYVSDNRAICYFNILAERRNRPELFLKSIRQQLIHRYQLQNAGDADLRTLLSRVAQNLSSGEHLVIVVDALDEVEQEPGENLLHLPIALPDRVYFLLTRRPYNLGKKRLTVSPGVPVVELDLTAKEYEEFNREDVKAYIRLCLDRDPDYRDGLRKWIQERHIAPEAFVEQVAEKSENNFMYLRYVLPGIAAGDYDDLSLKELPQGLQEYYQTHWVRMGMETEQQEIMAIILFILVEIGTPIPCEMIADIARKDESQVGRILDEWVEYLTQQEIEGETCYSIYHASFLDFLKGKRELKNTRKLFQDVNQRISEYLYL